MPEILWSFFLCGCQHHSFWSSDSKRGQTPQGRKEEKSCLSSSIMNVTRRMSHSIHPRVGGVEIFREAPLYFHHRPWSGNKRSNTQIVRHNFVIECYTSVKGYRFHQYPSYSRPSLTIFSLNIIFQSSIPLQVYTTWPGKEGAEPTLKAFSFISKIAPSTIQQEGLFYWDGFFINLDLTSSSAGVTLIKVREGTLRARQQLAIFTLKASHNRILLPPKKLPLSKVLSSTPC